MAELEIGHGKSARRSYGFDDVSIVPSRRTRDPRDVDISWEIDAYRFELPVLGAPSDAVTSPASAVALGRAGGGGVLNLEGLWTRYEDPTKYFEELATLSAADGNRRLRALYEEPIKSELIKQRIEALNAADVVSIAALRPQLVNEFAEVIARSGLDLLVIQGTVVSAEHKSRNSEPLNLKRFIREFEIPTVVGGCASYQAALHLMRTGAMGILVGVGSAEASTTSSVLGIGVPQATAIADAKGARMRHLDETGVYCHVIADCGIRTSGDIAKAIACGADAVMLGAPLSAAADAPGSGWMWNSTVADDTLPRGGRVRVPAAGTLEEILVGPATGIDGRTNLFGGLRTALAMTGHETLKEFQKADLVLAPGLQLESMLVQDDEAMSDAGPNSLKELS